MEAELVGEGDQRPLIDQLTEDHVEVSGDARIIRLGILLPHLLQRGAEVV